MARFDSSVLYGYDRSIRDVAGVVIGTDEAGRGPLAGPVVAAAVLLDLDAPIAGLNDSKKLSARQRDALYGEITTRAVAWSCAEASVQEIDSLNILNASLLAMKRAIEKLTVEWSLVLVDGNRLIHGVPQERQNTLIHGDGLSASIAAASIIAKVTRDTMMVAYHEHYPVYGFDGHKGYPTPAHKKAIKMAGLSPIHRRSFCEEFYSQCELDLV